MRTAGSLSIIYIVCPQPIDLLCFVSSAYTAVQITLPKR
jgi:hypothetical protein